MKLTQKLRIELKKPLGRLIPELIPLNEDKIIITVGDEASRTVLEAGIKPKIIVYDGLTARKPIEIPDIIKEYGFRRETVENPPGTLEKNVFKVFQKAFNTDSTFSVFVEGEEDLTALAAISEAPLDSIVLYGQPGGGIVLVEVDEVIKDKVSKIIGEMEDGC